MKTLIEQAKMLINKKLKGHPKRLAHCYGVAETARKLAMIYEINPDDAELIGLFHDYAKYDKIVDQAKVIDDKIVKKYENHQVIYHAYAASYWIKTLLQVTDETLLSAINHHVWGIPNMPMLDKILFVADYCEPTRPFSDRDYIYELAIKDLDEAVRYCMKSSIDDLKNRGLSPSPESLEAYQYYAEGIRGITK